MENGTRHRFPTHATRTKGLGLCGTGFWPGLGASDTARLVSSFSPNLSPADLSAYDGIRFYYRGKGYFRFRSLQPTITDWDDYGTSAFQATLEWQPITISFKDLKQEGWGVTVPFTPRALSGLVLEMARAPDDIARPPAGLFNGMIAPLIPTQSAGLPGIRVRAMHGRPINIGGCCRL